MSVKPKKAAGPHGSAPLADRSGGGRRSAARLAAVQALYEIDIAGAGPDPVLSEFVTRRWSMNAADDVVEGGDPQSSAMVEPDIRFLTDLVHGASRQAPSLDEKIGPTLEGDWTVERLEVLLRAILRAGTYELTARVDVPAETVINEYVNVAHAFFAGREPALVNAVLDKLAHALRPGELDGKTQAER